MNVLVVDVMPLFCEGIHRTLLKFDAGINVTYRPTLDEALEVREIQELILIEFDFIHASIKTSLSALFGKFPGASIVLTANDKEIISACSAILYGIAGILPRTATAASLSLVLSHILDGGIFFPGSLIPSSLPEQIPGKPFPVAADIQNRLTDRQMEILTLLAQGKSNKEICRLIGIAEGTVKNHIRAIFQALGVHNRTEAARYTL